MLIISICQITTNKILIRIALKFFRHYLSIHNTDIIYMFKFLPITFALILINSSNAFAIKLSSESFKNRTYLADKYVYNGFGCSGDNISPELSWTDIPEGTKSFAITAYDPDAPTGSGWWHWLVFNIPTNITNIPEGVKNIDLPKAIIQSNTDYGKPGYGGPCPPIGDGKHRYIFTIFALDTETLPLNAKVTAAKVGFYLNSHVIEKYSIKGYYKR